MGKADDASTDTSVAEDASVAEDTSTNEEAQDTEDLDDFELTDEDIENGDVETKESEESEDESPASEESDETEEDSAEDGSDESSQDQESGEEDTASEESKRNAAEEAYRQREAQRLAKLAQDKAQAQLEYLNGAEDEKDLALRQLQIDAYNNKVTNNTRDLESGIRQAVATIDLFQSGPPEAKAELANALDDFDRMYIVRDRNGDPIEVRGDVYQFLQSKADSIRRLTGVGARQQAKDKTKTTARTVTTPSRTPKQPKVDPDIAAFEEEANRW